MIPRLHLFEFEDQPWFSVRIRNYGTDYIRFIEQRFRLHEPVVPLLVETLRASGEERVIDLCAGGGGAALALARDVAAAGVPLHIVLTDRYPNLTAFEYIAQKSEGAVSFVAESIDARAVPRTFSGFRTLFNAFHHFRPRDARALLQNAVDARRPIGVFEIPERSLLAILPLFLTPLSVLLATPFIRPFRWQRLFWTYLLPIVPLFCWWDGLVSQLRAYSEQEMLELAAGLGDGSYEWRSGRVAVSSIPVHVTWLIGRPLGSS